MEIINVTKTFLPPLEEYEAYLKQIWDRGLLTNQGPILLEFEKKLQNYLHINNFHFVTNGTVALQVALRALNITEGEVITTPFSYVATTSTILWERCKPVFVDIEADTFCIDADKIEAAITKETKAIMAVHVFGYPCDVIKIEAIAKKYDLKVIYDAAHAFGVKLYGRSIFSFGDISTCSFHSTKVFQTIEGGCVIANEDSISENVELIKRFGHTGDDHYMLGINAKASEFQAAMGLCNLKYVNDIIKERKKISQTYDTLLTSRVVKSTSREGVTLNYAYYPIVFEDEKLLLRTVKELNKNNIFPRRYFYPSLNNLPYIEDSQSCPLSEDISKKILCLPLYSGLNIKSVERISRIVNESI